ncbi:hypothetical protein LC605_13870 [Nostoc sp. CHAB 5836]|uniref:hypothetical protein n=1 Tax=Nostoc sp. CHAB 5836 TaxID=2780404 RepID=UPI001E628E05|nr:hypothetical protein [Nostoc sp. CHAB 5836]MCC5616134.1 hypothetical protein [Nostoc sp. CHAB 5836]
MLGFVPQPNLHLHQSDFLGKTYAVLKVYCIQARTAIVANLWICNIMSTAQILKLVTTYIKVLQRSSLSLPNIPDYFYRVCLTGIFARVSIRRQRQTKLIKASL